jgi:aminopeptidase N
MPVDANPQLVARVAGVLLNAHDLFTGDAANQALVARFAGRKLSPVLARLGMAPRAGEPTNNAVLRSQLIAVLGSLGDKAVLAEALRRFAALERNPQALDGPLRTTILSIVASQADEQNWTKLHTMALGETVPLVRAQLYRLLASSDDERLAQRALTLALTSEPGATNASTMVSEVSSRHPDLAFEFATANREKVLAMVDVSSSSRYIPALASGSANPGTVAKLQAFAEGFMTPQSRRPADIAISRIRDRIRVRQTAAPAIAQWLKTHS